MNGRCYWVVDHEVVDKSLGGDDGRIKRIDQFELKLADTDIPSAVMRERVRELCGTAREVSLLLNPLEPYAHRVEIDDPGLVPRADDAMTVRAMSLEYTCPFCGETFEVRRDRWVLALSYREDPYEAFRAAMRNARACPGIVGIPGLEQVSHVRTVFCCDLVPLPELFREYGPASQTPSPVRLLLSDLESGTLSPDWRRGSGHWYALDDQLEDVCLRSALYQCDSCGAVFRSFARVTGARELTAFEHHSVMAWVAAGDAVVRISFAPALGGVLRRVEFDLIHGTTLFEDDDGQDLLEACGGGLDTVVANPQDPLGFALTSSCVDMYGLVAQHLREHVDGVDRALRAIGSVRGGAYGVAPAVESPGDAPLLALAIANRLRGYPTRTYEALACDGHVPCLPRCDDRTLPVDCSLVPYAMGTEVDLCHPNIRIAIFRNPLGLAALKAMGGSPFGDKDVLYALLDNDRLVGRIVRVLGSECPSGDKSEHLWNPISVIAGLRGCAFALRLLIGCMDWELRDMFCIVGEELACDLMVTRSCEVIERADPDAMIRLAQVLALMGRGYGVRMRDDCGDEERALEDVLDGYSFKLPQSLEDVALAGMALGRSALVRSSDAAREPCLLVFRDEAAVAAVEVSLPHRRVCDGACLGGADILPGTDLHMALLAWSHKYGLVFSGAD